MDAAEAKKLVRGSLYQPTTSKAHKISTFDHSKRLQTCFWDDVATVGSAHTSAEHLCDWWWFDEKRVPNSLCRRDILSHPQLSAWIKWRMTTRRAFCFVCRLSKSSPRNRTTCAIPRNPASILATKYSHTVISIISAFMYYTWCAFGSYTSNIQQSV